jgi:hypothetical protein
MNSAWTNQTTDVRNRTKLKPVDATATNWYDDVTNVVVANPGASIPRASINDPNDNDAWSSRYIEDGSYVRLKNVTLGYRLPPRVLQIIRVESVRVYLSGDNLWTLTRYSGPDPEVSTRNSVLTPGFDWSAYPRAFGLTAGINVTF